MSWIMDGMRCPLCNQAIVRGQDLLGFPMVGTSHPLLQPFDDRICHRTCLGTWFERDSFVLAWNEEIKYILDPRWFLEVTPSGAVRFLAGWGLLMYRWGLKRSGLLPLPISRRYPLLKLRAVAGHSPLWIIKSYGQLHANPSPRRLGLAAATVAHLEDWSGRFERLCRRSRRSPRPSPDEWKRFWHDGFVLWESLNRELGHRYRVVYQGGGRVVEPGPGYELRAVSSSEWTVTDRG